MTTAEFTLPYFEQGNHRSFHLGECAKVGEALERHAESMNAAAK